MSAQAPPGAPPGVGPGPRRRTPSRADIRRWRRFLADERAEATVYRDLARRRDGEERAILLALAEAERRHEAHWLRLLGSHEGRPLHRGPRTFVLTWLARRFGSVFVLALAQRSEARAAYEDEADATAAMAADERIHEEVVRSLAARGRSRLSGSFRAAVFGANDGLVSNLALILGIGASGAGTSTVLLSGLAGLLAGALSMGAGEYVSVRSQRELLDAANPSPHAREALAHLDVNANELALVYRARGMSAVEAEERAALAFGRLAAAAADPEGTSSAPVPAAASGPVAAAAGSAAAASVTEEASGAADREEHETIGTALGAAGASFCFFAAGAVVPVLPFLLGLEGAAAIWVAVVLVGGALVLTGCAVGLLSGASPLRRALRQLAIGYGAAAATYGLGLVFGATVG